MVASLSFELRRFCHSSFLPISMGIAALLFAIAYTLGLGGDQSGSVSWVLLNTYVVFTQFGVFILPALMAAYVCQDFDEHDILFYRDLGFGSLTYHVSKTLAMVLFFSLGTVAGLTVTCAAFGDFRAWGVMLLHYEAVIVTYLSLYSIVSCVLGSFIQSFFSAMAYSVVMVFVALSVPDLRFLQFFDQNGFVYKDLAANVFDLSTFVANELPNLPLCLAYAAGAFALSTLVAALVGRRWVRNGIR